MQTTEVSNAYVRAYWHVSQVEVALSPAGLTFYGLDVVADELSEYGYETYWDDESACEIVTCDIIEGKDPASVVEDLMARITQIVDELPEVKNE